MHIYLCIHIIYIHFHYTHRTYIFIHIYRDKQNKHINCYVPIPKRFSLTMHLDRWWSHRFGTQQGSGPNEYEVEFFILLFKLKINRIFMIIRFVLALLRHYTCMHSTKVLPRKIYFSRRNLKRSV